MLLVQVPTSVSCIWPNADWNLIKQSSTNESVSISNSNLKCKQVSKWRRKWNQNTKAWMKREREASFCLVQAYFHAASTGLYISVGILFVCVFVCVSLCVTVCVCVWAATSCLERNLCSSEALTVNIPVSNVLPTVTTYTHTHIHTYTHRVSWIWRNRSTNTANVEFMPAFVLWCFW